MRAASLAAGLLVALAGCGSGDTVEGPTPSAPRELRVSSPAFRDGGTVPARFTCDGENVSPPLRWAGVPAKARELAVLVEDPDAPGGTFVHWAAFGIDPSRRGLGEGDAVPREGKNSFGDEDYGGPCPPEDDEPHRYVFAVYALSDRLALNGGASPDGVRSAIGRVALARGTLTASYGR
jgi:Raf kinase inhibitor-like YbhB/YbcL family protein